MKIKTDFITNSSSSAFIIIENTPIKDLNIEELALEDGVKKHYINEYLIFKGGEIKELQKYHNGGKPFDWIEIITGVEYGIMGACYEDTSHSVKNNQTVHYFICERGEADLHTLLADYDVNIIQCEEY